MKLKIQKIKISGSAVIETNSHKDDRGRFARLFCEQELKPILGNRSIKQINFSESVDKGTIRGLHFQYTPQAEMKFVRCLNGRIFDVIVDLRPKSETYLKWHAEELSGDDMKMLVIPEGCAHGFQTLESNCQMLYLHTALYTPENEAGIKHDDSAIGINWPLPAIGLSTRDQAYPLIDNNFEGIKL